MARKKIKLPGAKRTIKTVVQDVEGNPLAESTADGYMIHLLDGSVVTFQQNTAMGLYDGRTWHPGMKNVQLAICRDCRKPPYTFPVRRLPRSGLVSLQDGGIRCAGCLHYLCPDHAHRCSDGSIRCSRCRFWFRLRSIGRKLFMTSSEG